MADKEENKQPAEASDDDEESEEEIEQIELDTNLLEAAKNNNIEDTELWLDKGGNSEYEKEGWNAVLWAACNGNEQMLRLFHRRGLLNPYIGEP